MIFEALLAGHLIGDWIIQTDYQAANKMISWKANQQHMLGYHITLGLMGSLVLGWMPLSIVLVVSYLSHSLIDRRWPVKRLMALTGSKPFSETMFGLIAVDQALHLSILCGLAILLA